MINIRKMEIRMMIAIIEIMMMKVKTIKIMVVMMSRTTIIAVEGLGKALKQNRGT